MNDAIFGGALAIQGTKVLKDQSVSGLTSTATGFVGIGVAGAMSNMAFGMVQGKRKRRR